MEGSYYKTCNPVDGTTPENPVSILETRTFSKNKYLETYTNYKSGNCSGFIQMEVVVEYEIFVSKSDIVTLTTM